MARKKSSRKKKKTTRAAKATGSGVLLKEASAAQLERELQKRREKEVAALVMQKTAIDLEIARLRNNGGSSSRKSAPRWSKGAYTPRPGSHGDLVLQALGQGGAFSLDDLVHATGAGKPTLSAAVLPKLLNEGLVAKAGRGMYQKA